MMRPLSPDGEFDDDRRRVRRNGTDTDKEPVPAALRNQQRADAGQCHPARGVLAEMRHEPRHRQNRWLGELRLDGNQYGDLPGRRSRLEFSLRH